ncbi:MAG: glycosyltransferase [Chloroflexi bacterium]|nr:MAG: glycosyltransferase [Chloroflexota bacterium]
MNLTLLTHRFLPRYFGGVETYTLRLAQALQKRGHQVHILTGEPVSRSDRRITRADDVVEGIPVTRLVYDFLRFPVTSRAAYADPAFTAAIQAALAGLRPDLVHATSLSLLMGGAIEAAHNLGLPLVYTATDYVLTCRRGTYVRPDNTICAIKESPEACTVCMGPHTRLERTITSVWQLTPPPLRQPVLHLAQTITGKHADFLQAAASIAHRFAYLPAWRDKISHIIAPCTYMRDMLVLNGFPAQKITVAPYGILPPPPDFKKEPAPVVRFGYLGRMTYIKGVHLLLEAFAGLPESLRQNARLTLYGEADHRSEGYWQALQGQARDLPQVKFAGRIDNAAISQVYRQLDCLVVPSLWPENSPITILEAQAHGIPVIASDAGGIRDLIEHERNGLIFACSNTGDLQARLARCLTSPDLLPRLAAQSHLIRSLDEDCTALIALYKKFTNSP